ncbi:MAG: hypothetical protein Q9162_000223 [Coniocarpon cinnabarinum]
MASYVAANLITPVSKTRNVDEHPTAPEANAATTLRRPSQHSSLPRPLHADPVSESSRTIPSHRNDDGTVEAAGPASKPSDVESSNPPSPRGGPGPVGVVQNWRNPPITKWRVLSTCLGALGQGFSDSAPGALLPYIEAYYHVNYAVVSMIFVANAVGFIAAALFVYVLDRRLGRAKTLLLCEAMNVIAFAVMVIPPPFPLFVIGYFIAGFAFAVTLALNNVFCANGKSRFPCMMHSWPRIGELTMLDSVSPATTVLGAFHGAYGIGGTIAPLIATAIINSGIRFSRFYALLLAIRIVIAASLGYTFWDWKHEIAASSDDIALSNQHTETGAEQPTRPPRSVNPNSGQKPSQLLAALSRRPTLVGALFIFAYQGAEVSISGWVISFLITFRQGDPSKVGNVTAGISA